MASIIKVDTIQDQDGNNIISEAANTITIGASGDTITIPSGATLANSGIVTGFQSTGIDDNATSTAITINSSQNVGIGTSSPVRLLSLNAVSPSMDFSNGTWLNEFINSAGQMEFRADHTNAAASSVITFSVDGSEAMRITSAGNVGIGTTSPSTNLDVEGTGVIAEFKSTNNNNVLRIKGNNATNGVILGSTSSDDFIFTTNTTERMRIENSSGNVGIGTASPAATLDVNGGLNCGFLQSNSSIYATSGIFRSSDGTAATPSMQPGVDANTGFFRPASDTIGFSTTGTERMRIDSTGGLRINATGALFNGNSNEKFTVDAPTGQAGSMSVSQSGYPIMYLEHHSGGSQYIFQFRQGNPSATVGSIQVSGGSSTSYVTTSDYRLKENVSYVFDATTRLKQLRPARFNFIANPDTTVDGFLAHEVSSIVPEAITGEKDAMTTEEYEITPAVLDEDGNVITEAVMGTREVPDYQGIDQSKLVPLLVKTIQELEARITALENK